VTIAELGERLLGGILPAIRSGREVFPVDGTAYALELTLFRRRFTIGYHTPRHPRDVRRVRADERTYLKESVRRHTADEPSVQVGDIIPGHRWIHVDVAEFRNCEGDLWRRAVGEECYTADDVAELGDRAQRYDWVHTFTSAGQEVISGHCTDEGALDYAPLTVTKVRDQTTDH
jgi:hypothetical protein